MSKSAVFEHYTSYLVRMHRMLTKYILEYLLHYRIHYNFANERLKIKRFMFGKWIDESEFDEKNDFFDNSVMSVRHWLAVISVMIIPIVNIVIIFWWAFADKELTNSNKVNWARASVIMFTITIIVITLLGGFLLFGLYIHKHFAF